TCISAGRSEGITGVGWRDGVCTICQPAEGERPGGIRCHCLTCRAAQGNRCTASACCRGDCPGDAECLPNLCRSSEVEASDVCTVHGSRQTGRGKSVTRSARRDRICPVC